MSPFLTGFTRELATIKVAAELTAAGRAQIKKKHFALPAPKGEPAEKGGYPVQDRGHAANAIARSKSNASPAEQAKIKSKACAAFPTLPSCK